MKKYALVTGASTGIGEALCRELIKKKWIVIGVARSIDKLKAFESEFGKNVFLPFVCDVAKSTEINRVSSELKQKNIIPELFFLNAGICGLDAMESKDKININFHRNVFDVNYFGVLNWISEWSDICRNSIGATFMVTSSLNAIFPPPRASAYSASKSAIAKAFESYQIQFINTNLHFLIVYPGPVNTKGLVGKVPFTWSPEKMAKSMIKSAFAKKLSSKPSPFHSILCHLFRWIPNKILIKIFGNEHIAN